MKSPIDRPTSLSSGAPDRLPVARAGVTQAIHGEAVAILGPFGPPQLACLRSWKRLGASVVLAHTDDVELGPNARKHFDHYRFFGPTSGLDQASLARIGDFLAETRSKGLVCVAEALAIKLGTHRECFPQTTRLLVSKPQTLDRLVSKLHQIDTAQRCGFRVLPSWTLTAGRHEVIDAITYPTVLRPDRPEAVHPLFKAELFRSANDARRFLATIKPDSGPLVAQPYIAGPSLVIHGSRSLAGELGPIVAYLVDIKYQGVSVSLRPIPLAPALKAACKAFVDHEDVVGVFHFDLMLDAEGNAWFLELNARMGGTTAKVYASGLDEPAQLLDCYGLLAEGMQMREEHLEPAVSRIAAAKCLLSTLGGNALEIDYPYPRISRLLASTTRAVLGWPDEVLSLRSLGTTLAYLFPKR